MSKAMASILASLLCWFLIGLGQGEGRAAPPARKGDVPVTVTFRDDFSDRIGSDCGSGEECPYSHGVGGVYAVIRDVGQLILDTNGGRGLSLDFSAQANCDPNGCHPPFGQDTVEAYMNTVGGELNLLQMPVDPDATQPSKFQVFFDDPDGGDFDWFVRFDPTRASCSGSSTVTVRHPDANLWVIEAETTDIACLVTSSTKGRLVFTNQGNYFMPFKAFIARK